MKKIVCLISLFIVVAASVSNAQTAATNNSYDPQLAKKLGADDYGMRHYVMAFLKKGPNQITDSAKRVALQRGHLKNIIRLSNEGKLVVAGPFLDDQEVEGIFVFNVATISEAQALINSDPAIQAGLLKAELRPWYCSAALMEVGATHKKLEKKSVADF